MSILRTHNLQNPDSSSINIVMDKGGNTNITGVTTVGSNFHVTDGISRIGALTEYGLKTVSDKGLIVSSSGEHTLKLIDTTNYATNVGASILLGGQYRASGDAQEFVKLKSLKENSSNGNYAYGFSVSTNPNGGVITERFRITSAGDVGIGEDSPVTRLHLANSGSGNVSMTITNDTTGHTSGNGVEIGMGADEQAQIWNYENSYFRIGTNNVERLRITSNGRVSIGNGTNNASPTAKFQVKADDGEAADLYVGVFENLEATAGQSYGVNIRAGSNSTDHGFRVKNRANDTTQFLVRGDGNVGVGTIAPTGNFEVHGNDGINISNSYRTGTNGVQWRLIPHNGGGSTTNLRLYEGAGATEVINITKTGRIGVNRMTPSFMLDIRGNSSTGANCIRITDAAETGHGSHPAKIVAGGTYYHEMQMHTRRFAVHTYDGSSIAERFRVHQDGNVGVNITNPLSKLHVNLTKSSGSSTAERTKQHAAMRLSLDRTSGSMPYLGWGPALDFYSDNYDGATQRPNARIAGTISNYSAGHEGGQLRFYTTPTDTATTESDFAERMRIDANGYITKPNTPAFFVYKATSTWALAAHDVFIFDTAELNVGGHYSTSNGRFTAPITARYVFHFYSIFTGNALGDSIEMYKNGSRMYGGDVHFTSSSVGSNWDSVHYSRVIQLSGGDYVHMQTRTGHTFHGNHWGGWSGYMLG